jgi:hypothetical protein
MLPLLVYAAYAHDAAAGADEQHRVSECGD